MKQVSIIGTGNVAFHLSQAILKLDQWNLHQVFGRKKSATERLKKDLSSKRIQTIHHLNDLEEVDIVLCCISDDAIQEVVPKLKLQTTLIAHTSGATALQNTAVNNAVFYPLQSFSKLKVLDYQNIPFCLEADSDKNLKLIKDLAGSISTKVYKINSNQRLQLHLAAVFVNNFTNYMVKIGEDLCQQNDIDSAILQPLISETFEKLKQMPAFEAQTGPAKRQDHQSISAHFNLLKNTNYQSLYHNISQHILNDYGKKL
ncbi:Rossmann-like and DUF2520 domain-containing protein [Psychroflexus sp. ALD_RP9]|uniref:Rossmann-like and DUF2520 domain-containing protein n=1 Tax=Psychroflexus sp. ALD_RP9 TaxID=2777186 RepID=UPI001A8F94DD|nr:DUF2520 domain-containing protein [Psychroflexus sp. ALD_RP9]QSS97412.1 DUF2520 domain-containing protein [Psychroflexus sp. ALD_RP9]